MTPMQLGVAVETQVFLFSCLAGLGLGAAYDCLRVFRTLIPHNKIFIFIEDFLYALLFGFVYFVFAIEGSGQLRFFILVGMLIGALLERILLGNFVVFVVGAVANVIWKYIVNPVVSFITKIALIIKPVFVRNTPTFRKSKKIREKALKV